MDYYHFDVKTVTLLPDLDAYLKKQGYTKDQIDILKSNSGTLGTAATLARMLSRGMPDFHQGQNEYWISLDGTLGEVSPVSTNIKKMVDDVLGRNKVHVVVKDKDDKEERPKKTVQEHMRDKANAITGEVEGLIDDFTVEYKNPEKFSVMSILQSREYPAQMIHIVKSTLQNLLNEIKELQEGSCDQLNEAYSFLGKIQVRNFIKFLEQGVADCDNFVQVKKATRKPRARKQKTPQQLVKTFKYCKEFAGLKLKSESPTKLVDASEAWLYNTKNRKLIHVVADDLMKVFTVKGSSIVGFDTSKTVQKTLRKPAEQLKLITGVGKPAARKNFASIKATEIKFNGRGNEHIIILKAH